MGGGPGAGAALIQAVLVMLIAIPAHLLTYPYLRMPSVVRWILTSLGIASIALIFPLAEWMYFGAEAAFYQPLEVWLWKNFVLSLFIAILAGIPFIVASLKK